MKTCLVSYRTQLTDLSRMEMYTILIVTSAEI